VSHSESLLQGLSHVVAQTPRPPLPGIPASLPTTPPLPEPPVPPLLPPFVPEDPPLSWLVCEPSAVDPSAEDWVTAVPVQDVLAATRNAAKSEIERSLSAGRSIMAVELT
jgi:hypothetical protein